MSNVKQVIVMRTDLNMRKGKMIAQGSHASMAWMVDYGSGIVEDWDEKSQEPGRSMTIYLSPAQVQWMKGSFTKVCVRVESEEELLAIKAKADEAGLLCRLIQDKGLTEFGGVPTYTCLAIGPDYSDKIDPITGQLKLL